MTRESVPVILAIALYRIWGNWTAVANRLRRRNGMPFKACSVSNAVRRYDRGAA